MRLGGRSEEGRRFEYVVRDCGGLTGPDLEERLNALAVEGWEPVLVVDRFLVLRREAGDA